LKFAPWVRGVGYLLVVMKGITFVISVEMPPTDEVLLCATTILHLSAAWIFYADAQFYRKKQRQLDMFDMRLRLRRQKLLVAGMANSRVELAPMGSWHIYCSINCLRRTAYGCADFNLTSGVARLPPGRLPLLYLW
jgi:hypothetical protein